jgi:hypothetical protein
MSRAKDKDHAPKRPTWKQLNKVEASVNGRGKIVCKSSAALRIECLFSSITVFGSVSIEEWTGTPKVFRIVYSGTTMHGQAESGSVELPKNDWLLDSVKAKSCNAKARLLLMRFAHGDITEVQLTIPIFSHKDSKESKVIVDALLVYGAHHIKRKTVRVGKEAMTND